MQVILEKRILQTLSLILVDPLSPFDSPTLQNVVKNLRKKVADAVLLPPASPGLDRERRETPEPLWLTPQDYRLLHKLYLKFIEKEPFVNQSGVVRQRFREAFEAIEEYALPLLVEESDSIPERYEPNRRYRLLARR